MTVFYRDDRIDGVSKRNTVCTKVSDEDKRIIDELIKRTGSNKAEILRLALHLLFVRIGVGDEALRAQTEARLSELAQTISRTES